MELVCTGWNFEKKPLSGHARSTKSSSNINLRLVDCASVEVAHRKGSTSMKKKDKKLLGVKKRIRKPCLIRHLIPGGLSFSLTFF